MTNIIIKMHCKRRVQIHDLQGIFTACTRLAHSALEDHTALPQYSYSALSNTLFKHQAAAFVLSMFKINAADGVLGDCTAFSQHCWRLHSVHLSDLFLTLWKHCEDAALK